MVARASGSAMGVGRFSRPLREVRVLAMQDVKLDKTHSVESLSVWFRWVLVCYDCLYLAWRLEYLLTVLV
jgi:hypothetical protein